VIKKLDQVLHESMVATYCQHWQRQRVTRHGNQRFDSVSHAMRWMLWKVAATKKRATQEMAPRAALWRYELEDNRLIAPHESRPIRHCAPEEVDVLPSRGKLKPKRRRHIRESLAGQQDIARARFRPMDRASCFVSKNLPLLTQSGGSCWNRAITGPRTPAARYRIHA
jgi:hypothetical protein